MCYMVERIGIRELRQHASRFVERVHQGERFFVTNRGMDTAELVPIPGELLDRLRTQQRLRPATTSLSDLAPPPVVDEGRSGSAALQELREER